MTQVLDHSDVGESSGQPVKDVAVFGERCSGTNYVEALIGRNFSGLAKNTEYGWKHGFINPHYIRPTSFFVVVVRDALDWFRSFHRTPHQVGPWSKTADLSEFLRHEWSCVTNGRILHKTSKQLGLSWHDELMCERHPMTGARIENVVELRNLKLASMRKLQALTPNVAIIRYEDACAEPEATVSALQRRMRICGPEKFIDVNEDMSRVVGHYKPDRKRRLKDLEAYAPHDLIHLASALNLKQERSFGYAYDLPIGLKRANG